MVPLDTPSELPGVEQSPWLTLEPANGSGCAAMVTGVGVNEPPLLVLKPPGPPIAAAVTVEESDAIAASAADESTTMSRSTASDEVPVTARASDPVGSSTQTLPPPEGVQFGPEEVLVAPAVPPASVTTASADSESAVTTTATFLAARKVFARSRPMLVT